MKLYWNLGLVLLSLALLTCVTHASFTASLLPKSGAYDSGQAINFTAAAGGTTSAPPYNYTLYGYISGAYHQVSVLSSSSATAHFYVIAQPSISKYRVAIKDSGPGKKTTANSPPSTFRVNDQLVASQIAPASPSIDNGQAVRLYSSITGGSPKYTYQWFSAQGTSSPGCTEANAIAGATSKTYDAAPNSTTSYAYQATDSANPQVSACSLGDTVAVYADPYISVEPAGAALDLGQSIVLNSTVSGGTGNYTWQWYDGGKIKNAEGTGATATYSASKAGNYHVEFTDAGTGTARPAKAADAKSVPVKVTTSLQKPALYASNATIDKGQIETLVASAVGGTPNYTYRFNDVGTGRPIPGCDQIPANTCTFAPNGTDSYTVRVKDSGTRPEAKVSQAVQVTVNPALSVPGISASNSTIAEGQPETLTATASGGTPVYSYSFTDIGTNAVIPGCVSVQSRNCTFIPLYTDSYAVRVADNASTPSVTESPSVKVNVKIPLATPALAPSGASVDLGQNLTLSASVSGGTTAFTYTFTDINANAPIPGCGGISVNTCTFKPSANDSYTVSLVSNVSSAYTTTSIPVSVAVFPIPEVTASGNATAYVGQQITITSNLTSAGSGSVRYQWYNGTSPIQNASSSYYSAIAGATGTFNYSVRATDSDNVTAASNPVPVTVNPLKLAVAQQPQSTLMDSGQTITLSSTLNATAGNYTWQWYDGNATVATAAGNGTVATYNATSSGSYRAVFTRMGTPGITGSSAPANITIASQIYQPRLDSFSGATGAESIGSVSTGSMTTAGSNDMLVAVVLADGGVGAPGVSDTAGSTWALAYGSTNGLPGECGNTWIFYSKPGKKLSGDVVSDSRVAPAFLGLFVMAVQNATAFDANATLPSVSAAAANHTSATYSTTNANDLAFGAASTCHTSGSFYWGGLTALSNTGYQFAVADRSADTPLANASASITEGADLGTTADVSVAVAAVSDLNVLHLDPAISVQPKGATTYVGQAATLTSSVSGGTGSFSWQWYNATSAIAGAAGTGSTATFTASAPGSYHAEFTDIGTGAAKPIETATSVSVPVVFVPAPSISVQPSGGALDTGQNVTISSQVTGGTGSFSWQWYNGANTIAGATGTGAYASYVTPNAGNYSVRFRDTGANLTAAGANLTSAAARMALYSAPSILIQPASGTVKGSVPAHIDATVSGGTGSFSWQWYNADGTTLAGASGTGLVANYSTAVPGTYRAVFTDTGTAASARPAANATTLLASVTPVHLGVPAIDAHAVGGGDTPPPITTSAFTTTSANDTIVAIASADGGTGTPRITDTAGLNWTLAYGGTSGLQGECGSSWIFYAKPGKTVATDKLTATRSGAVFVSALVVAAKNASVFDSNSTLPSIATTGYSTAISTKYSTSSANDLILGISSTCYPANPSWYGLTPLDSANGEFSDAYKIVNTTQVNATATVLEGDYMGIVVTALSSP
ncbi:MAG: hypothetical protein KGH60_02985 [Candidatus Micrarchaeota archaeon]|nr:hypothetical protein [Candidatus Micrarchaeota archaeon]